MFTLGFRFKPWTSEKAIADGPDIMAYLKETVAEYGIDKHIRYGQNVEGANWSDDDNRWTVSVERDGEQVEISARYLMACSGYYNYEQGGFSPEFAGAEDFEGTIVHPQHWPEDLDYAGKRIVVIGSGGATAVTLIPALASSGAGHVTMLQRSPTFIAALPDIDPFTVQTNKRLPEKAAYVLNRWKSIVAQSSQYQIARRFPEFFRKQLLTMARRRLPEGYDVNKHFNPSYNPWDQRVCLAPNGDLFKTIRAGKADVVTDTIERFTKTGIKLSSGQELDADIIITATGLNLQLFGGGRDLPQRRGDRTQRHHGLQGHDADPHAEHGVHDRLHQRVVDAEGGPGVRVLLPGDQLHGRQRLRHRRARHPGNSVEERPLMDFTPGYVLRALDYLPKQGSRAPWRLKQNYLVDLQLIRRGKVDDAALAFSRHRVPVATSAQSA